MLEIDADKTGLKFTIYVQPRSSRNQIVGLFGDALKVKIKAPPVEGAANKMCITVLAKALNVPKSAIEIVSGQASRTKRVQVRVDKDRNFREETERLQQLVRSLF
jgi:uncharacterized protein